jgi:Carboxypeptidase regulatory-like domain
MLLVGLILALTLGAAAQPPTASQIKGPNGRVFGRVLESGTEVPIPGASIVFAFRGRSRLQAVTDQDGRYSLEELEPGPYRLTVQKTGYVPLDPASVPTYWVLAGQSLDVATVSLQKGGVVAGRVLDSFGEPMVDISVRAVKPGAAIDRMGEANRTNDLGEFRVFGLAAGEYIIAASPRPFGSDALSRTMVSSTFYPGTSDPSAAQVLTVRAGQTVAGIEFRTVMASTFRVSGTVVDELGMPVVGATVVLAGDSRASGGIAAGIVGETRSDGAGVFSINAVMSGKYYATAKMPASDPVQVIVTDADVPGVTIVVPRRR